MVAVAHRGPHPLVPRPNRIAVAGVCSNTGMAVSMAIQSLVVQVAPPTVTVIRAPGGGPLR